MCWWSDILLVVDGQFYNNQRRLINNNENWVTIKRSSHNKIIFFFCFPLSSQLLWILFIEVSNISATFYFFFCILCQLVKEIEYKEIQINQCDLLSKSRVQHWFKIVFKYFLKTSIKTDYFFYQIVRWKNIHHETAIHSV